MNDRGGADPKLQAALEALSEGARPAADCPPTEDIWAAVHGDLPAERTRRLGSHTVECAACAELWRLARELGAGPVAVPATNIGRRAGLAAAAVLAVVAVSGFVILRDNAPPGAEPGFRTSSPRAGIQSLIPEGQALSRADGRLKWEGPDGSVYMVMVTTGDLRPLFEATDLTTTSVSIPPDLLSSLPDGTVLLWSVTAELPGGGEVSRAFSSALSDEPVP